MLIEAVLVARGRGENMNKKSNGSSGMSFLEVLLVVFIVLKLLGVIAWSWVWVLSPIWIGVLIAVVAGIVLTLLD